MYRINKLVTGMEKRDDYREQIAFGKKLRATYLREVIDANEGSIFIRLVDIVLDCREEIVSKKSKLKIWKGSAKGLAKYHVLNNMVRDESGKFIKPRNLGAEARRVCDRYCKEDGGLYKVSTIQKEIGKVVRGIEAKIDAENQRKR